MALLMLLDVSLLPAADDAARQARGLDEQVLDIKSDMLAIADELNRLEEQLLYPSHTQVSVFVSMREKQSFRLDSVDIEFDGAALAHHIYSPKELDALQMGGVQRIYTGNVSIGQHELKVTMRGKSAGGDYIRLVRSFPIEKGVEAEIAELMLAERSIILIDK